MKYIKLFLLLIFIPNLSWGLNQANINDLYNKIENKYPLYEEAIVKASVAAGNVPVELIQAVIFVESRFIEKARSNIKNHSKKVKHAYGLMQLIPGTALRFNLTFDKISVPSKNIAAGVKYLSFLITKFSDISLALAGYNAGEHRVVQFGFKVPPYKETQKYVKNVTQALIAIMLKKTNTLGLVLASNRHSKSGLNKCHSLLDKKDSDLIKARFEAFLNIVKTNEAKKTCSKKINLIAEVTNTEKIEQKETNISLKIQNKNITLLNLELQNEIKKLRAEKYLLQLKKVALNK